MMAGVGGNAHAQSGHGGCRVADTGEDDPFGRSDARGVGADLTGDSEVVERPFHRGKVAGAVVDDHEHCTPFRE